MSDIPLMDYIVSGRNYVTMLDEVVQGIRKQSNVNKIIVVIDESSDDGTLDLAYDLVGSGDIDLLSTNPFSSVDAKIEGVKLAETEYIVLLDDDVFLDTGWIEKLWPETWDGIGAIYGLVVFDKYLDAWFRRTAKRREKDFWARMQNTIVRRELLTDMQYLSKGGIDPDIYFTDWLVNKGYKIILMPVISNHVKDCHAADIREGIRGGARMRWMGLFTLRSIVEYGISNILGGVRASLIMRTPYFIVAPVKKVLGMVIGYFAWDRFYIKYDFSCKR